MRKYGYKHFIEQSRSTVDSDGTWLITLADLMTLLMVFFVMFVIAKQAETEKKVRLPAAAGTIPNSSIRTTIRDYIALSIKEAGAGNDIDVRTEDHDVVVTLKESITFMPGKAVIANRINPVMERIADVIRKNPGCTIELDGYTDNVPIHTSRYRSNWDLSIARATSVLNYFIEEHGLDPSRFYIRGNADRRPRASNDTPEQRAQNRRVEIRLKNTSV